MKRNKKVLICATLFSTIALGIIAVPKVTSGLKTFASQPYACTLPAGYVEISEIIHDALGNTTSYAANAKSFRGTVTKRNGDYAYIQRVNQTDSKLYGIKVIGVNTYANDLAVGNVVDIAGGLIANDGGTPTYKFSASSTYSIVTQTNPTGFGEKELLNMDKVIEYRSTYTRVEYSYSSFMKVSQLKVIGIYENRELFTDGIKRNFLQLSSIDGTNKFFAIVNAGDFSVIKAKATQAINENKYLSVSGFFYGYAESSLLDVLSENDVTVEDSMIDTSVVVSREKMNLYTESTTPDADCQLFKLVGKAEIPYVLFDDFHENMVYSAMTHPERLLSNKHNHDVSKGQYVYYNDAQSFQVFVDTQKDVIAVSEDTTGGALNYHFVTNGGLVYLAGGIETTYCKINEASSVGRSPYNKDNLSFDLSAYGLDIVEDKYHNVYVPLHAMDYIFNATTDTVEFIFNGKDMYFPGIINNKELDTEGTVTYKYKHDTPWASGNGDFSETYGAYAYKVTCFALDYCYGLRKHRSLFKDAGNADALFESITFPESEFNLKQLLSDKASSNYELAMLYFAGKYFHDGHSGLTMPGHYYLNNLTIDTVMDQYATYLQENYRYHLYVDQLTLGNARAAAEKTVGYRKVGDTGIITFDAFVKSYNSKDVNVDNFTYAELQTKGSELLFKKAFKEITADDSIKNVVIDITLNGGGMLDALPWLEAYLTLDPSITCQNLLDGSCNEIHYKVDLNYDGIFDEKDSYVGKYNFFLMTSTLSFSCGNYFPTVIKEKGLAKIIGETSGGGACSVGYIGTPYGGILRNSSNSVLGHWDTVKGEFVINEEGITPDYTFSRSNFYNDEAILNFIHSILN